MRPHQKPCDCDACVDVLLAEAHRRLMALEIACAMAGMQVPSSPTPTMVGETWRAPTIDTWAWRDYERERRQLILAQLKAIAEAEGYLHERR